MSFQANPSILQLRQQTTRCQHPVPTSFSSVYRFCQQLFFHGLKTKSETFCIQMLNIQIVCPLLAFLFCIRCFVSTLMLHHLEVTRYLHLTEKITQLFTFTDYLHPSCSPMHHIHLSEMKNQLRKRKNGGSLTFLSSTDHICLEKHHFRACSSTFLHIM